MNLLGLKEFLNSEKEQHAWHRGIRKGYTFQRPKQLMSDILSYKSFKKWEDDEQHYEDTSMTLAFGLKKLVQWISNKAKNARESR